MRSLACERRAVPSPVFHGERVRVRGQKLALSCVACPSTPTLSPIPDEAWGGESWAMTLLLRAEVDLGGLLLLDGDVESGHGL